jgi:hypothetical protein
LPFALADGSDEKHSTRLIICQKSFNLSSLNPNIFSAQTIMATEFFTQTINHWINELEIHNKDQFKAKPAANSWSIGQVCAHLLDEAGHHLEQIEICLSNLENIDGEPTEEGKKILLQNEFPNIAIDGPMTHVPIPLPTNNQAILVRLFD